MLGPRAPSDNDASKPGLTLADRMGPVGYLARIAVAAVLGWFTYVLVARVGPDGFAEAGFTAYWYFWTALLVMEVAVDTPDARLRDWRHPRPRWALPRHLRSGESRQVHRPTPARRVGSSTAPDQVS